MKRLFFLTGILLSPCSVFADRLGSLNANSQIALSTQVVTGGNTNYIQNTLTPTTTTQVFSVRNATITGSIDVSTIVLSGLIIGKPHVVFKAGSSSGGNGVYFQDDTGSNVINFSRDGGFGVYRTIIFNGSCDFGARDNNNGPRDAWFLRSVDSPLITGRKTNNVADVEFVFTGDHDSNDIAGSIGFGSGLLLRSKTSTTKGVPQAFIRSNWDDATHATRRGSMDLAVVDTSTRTAISIHTDGETTHTTFPGDVFIGTPTTNRYTYLSSTTIKGYHDSAGSIIIQDGSGTNIFRGVSAQGWNNATSRQTIFFQIGPASNRYSILTAAGGNGLAQFGIDATNMQIGPDYSSWPDPTALLALQNDFGSGGSRVPLKIHENRSQTVNNIEIYSQAEQPAVGNLLFYVDVSGNLGLQSHVKWLGTTSTSVNQTIAISSASFLDSTHATRKGRLSMRVADFNGEKEFIRADTDGTAPYVTITGSTTFTAPVYFSTYTASTLSSLKPSTTWQYVTCVNCSAISLCVSTGSTMGGQWASAVSKNTACQ